MEDLLACCYGLALDGASTCAGLDLTIRPRTLKERPRNNRPRPQKDPRTPRVNSLPTPRHQERPQISYERRPNQDIHGPLTRHMIKKTKDTKREKITPRQEKRSEECSKDRKKKKTP